MPENCNGRTKNQRLAAVSKCRKRVFQQPASTSRTCKRLFQSVFGHKEIREEPVDAVARELFGNLSTNVLLDSDTLDVTFTYRDPRAAQTALKLILAAYMNHHVAVFQNTGESDLLKSQLDQAVDKYHDPTGEAFFIHEFSPGL